MNGCNNSLESPERRCDHDSYQVVPYLSSRLHEIKVSLEARARERERMLESFDACTTRWEAELFRVEAALEATTD
jgi:hypothetical protein